MCGGMVLSSTRVESRSSGQADKQMITTITSESTGSR